VFAASSSCSMRRAVRYAPLRFVESWYGKGASSGPSLALKSPRIARKLCAGTPCTAVARSSKNFSASSVGATLVGEYTTMTVVTGLDENSAIRILSVC
jgi:hypothetical protein